MCNLISYALIHISLTYDVELLCICLCDGLSSNPLESFTEQKILILMKSSLPIIFLWIVSLLYLKSIIICKTSRFSPMLPSRNFIVFQCTVESMIHFESPFVTDEKSVYKFFFFFFFLEKHAIVLASFI